MSTSAVHVHDVVTDCSYALAEFLVSTLVGAPWPILATFHIANVFLVDCAKQHRTHFDGRLHSYVRPSW